MADRPVTPEPEKKLVVGKHPRRVGDSTVDLADNAAVARALAVTPEQTIQRPKCTRCNDTGTIEVPHPSGWEEWGTIYAPCPNCDRGASR